MSDRVRIIGSYLSPYVRKVLVFLDLKGIGYEIDPIIPFLGDDRFSKLSPIRRIPVLIDDRVTLADSSVICQYLEDRYPEPSLYPADIADRARARWLEEYADTRMGEVLVWRVYNEVAIKRFVWGEETDDKRLQKALTEDVPQVLGYLEEVLPVAGPIFGTLSIADISIAALFRTAWFARFSVDSSRWPRTAAFVERTLALDAFKRLAVFEERLMRTPIENHRAVLAELGAPLTADTYGTKQARRGLMQL